MIAVCGARFRAALNEASAFGLPTLFGYAVQNSSNSGESAFARFLFSS